jgi:hypothetical protein
LGTLRGWVTLIAVVNAKGWAVPRFFIFKAKNHDSTWYHDIPKDWPIGVSDNGSTRIEIGLAWLQHFIKHTMAGTMGSHRLIIIDGLQLLHQRLLYRTLNTKHRSVSIAWGISNKGKMCHISLVGSDEVSN